MEEAPEKIYLQENTTTDCYGEFWPEWFEARNKDADVEYIRTDVFIEKAYNWLKNYAFVDDNKNVNLPTLLHDFLKDSRNF